MAAASFLLRRWSPSMKKVATQMLGSRGYAVSAGTDIIEAAPMSPFRRLDPGTKASLRNFPQLPSKIYSRIRKSSFLAFRVPSLGFVQPSMSLAIGITLRSSKQKIEFYGDFDGSFHKSMELGVDLSAALLGPRSHRWSAYVVDRKIKVFNLEKAPSEFEVSGGEVILGQI